MTPHLKCVAEADYARAYDALIEVQEARPKRLVPLWVFAALFMAAVAVNIAGAWMHGYNTARLEAGE